MSLQETAQIMVRLTVSTDQGELPTPAEFERLFIKMRAPVRLGWPVEVIATEVVGGWSGELV